MSEVFRSGNYEYIAWKIIRSSWQKPETWTGHRILDRKKITDILKKSEQWELIAYGGTEKTRRYFSQSQIGPGDKRTGIIRVISYVGTEDGFSKIDRDPEAWLKKQKLLDNQWIYYKYVNEVK